MSNSVQIAVMPIGRFLAIALWIGASQVLGDAHTGGNHADAKSHWLAISEPVTSKVKTEWPGMTAGVTVDRTTGDVFMVVSGGGIWKSSNRGATFERADGGAVGGRCETGYGLAIDPGGKQLFCFMLDGSSASTLDGGKTWEKLAPRGRGWDYAAVDWSAMKPQVIFGLEHEAGGKMWSSADGGQSWKSQGIDPKIGVGANFGVGVVNAHTFLRWKEKQGIERSVDAGATWTKVSDLVPVSHVMAVFEGTCYWLGEKGLLHSSDQGATWSVEGDPIRIPPLHDPNSPGRTERPPAPPAWGPYFGKDARQIVAVGKGGIFETTDAGKHWQTVGTLPAELNEVDRPGWFLNFAFDPVNNIFYASRMGKATYKLQR